jgi:transglutaminase-like putative cysteine protease
MMRRDALLTALLALVLAATVPSYDRVFTDTSWRAPVIAAALIALLVGAVSRRLRLPSLVTGGLSVLALLAVLPWLLEIGDGWAAGIGPQLEALRLTLAQGWTALAEEPSPAAPVVGLVLLTTIAWWAVAALTHEVLVRGGHVAAGLLHLTVLWVVPLAIPTTAEDTLLLVVPFLATSGLLLLAAVNTSDDAPQAIALPASGILLLVTAIAVGTVTPWLLPSYGGDAWLTLGAGSAPRGYQPIVDITNRLNAPEEREVLRVRSAQRTYLRLAGLDTFDGATWRLGPPGSSSFRPDPSQLFPADGPLPPEEPAASIDVVEVDVEVLELENIYVPLPYQPVEVLGPIRTEMVWSTQGGFLATWEEVETGDRTIGIRQGSAYRVLAERPTPSFAELTQATFPADVLATHTVLPRDYPELGAQAEAVYAAAGAETVVERALALQDWFVGPEGDFTYDLEVPALRGEDALTRFVLEDRVGYCEYFATAMAVMLRQTGIPARVAVGFLPGERVTTGDPDAEGLAEYVVTTRDAHAWVEVLFPGYGWITFEPTPRSDETQLLPRQDDLSPVENEAERAERAALEELDDTSTPDVPEVDPSVPEGLELPDDADQPLGLGEIGTSTGSGLLWWLAAAILFGLAGLAWSQSRRRRRPALADDPRGAVLAAQRRLYSSARRVGVDRAEHETAREVIARWEAQGWIDRGNEPTARLMQAAAFDGSLDPEEAAGAVDTLDGLAEQLLTRVRRREQLLVPLRRARSAVRGFGHTLLRSWRER